MIHGELSKLRAVARSPLTRLLSPRHLSRYFHRPQEYSPASALQSYIISDKPARGQKIHAHILKTGLTPDLNISIKLLILYLKSSNLTYARQVFDQLPVRTLSSYNYMISGYTKHGLVEKSFELVRQLFRLDQKPDGFTLSIILKGSTTTGHLIGAEVHAQILKLDVFGDDVLYTALVDSYVKSERLECARRVFDLMSAQNVICSTSMVTGYMNQARMKDAEEIFDKTLNKDVVVYNAMIEGYSKSARTVKKSFEVYINMHRAGFKPTISTFASMIGACSLLPALEFGQQIQARISKTDLFTDLKIGSALIDMYSKCGRADLARRIFDRMPKRNVFSWTSMIDGYGKNGCPHKSLALFDEMVHEHKATPNYVTFLGVISACAHAGLVAKGYAIFESMEKVYEMKPKMEHYACMVDLLGRAGSLNRALEFVVEMPERPNSDVWAALLGSCRLHGDVELARIAADELFKVSEGSRPGAYVSLSNTLAGAGRWENVSELRELMKARGISKVSGFAWIWADAGFVHGFHGEHALS